jgi:hypothetical protein
MTLSNKAVRTLAEAITPKVIDYIFESEQWTTFCHEIVPEAIDKELGEMDDDLYFELALCVMDRIMLKAM